MQQRLDLRDREHQTKGDGADRADDDRDQKAAQPAAQVA
jgi:hypothetical protein